MADIYKGWTISHERPPIPIRCHDWVATGPNYDCDYNDEDGFVSNGEMVHAATREALITEIDNYIEEHAA
jgi:hypothetical protein